MALDNGNEAATAPAVELATPHPLAPAEDYPSHIRFNPPAVILTSRLYLRRATEKDLPAIHNFLTNEETMKYMFTKVSASLADTEHWWRSRFVKDPITGEGGGEFIYLICLRDGDNEGEPIGTSGSRLAPHLGYQIGAGTAYWGKGYASEAVSGVINGICQTIQAEKQKDWEKAYIRIDVDAPNTGSIRVAEKVGGKKVGERIEAHDGKTVHVNEYRVYIKDWVVV